MTALADVAVEAHPEPDAASRALRFVPGLLVAVAVLYTTTLFAEATGGRGPFALTKAAVVVLVALVAVRPWRHLRTGVLVLAAAVAVAALVVCVLTPPGWFGANRAASYGLAAALFVTVAAYARRATRARTLGLLVAFAGAVQFFWAFLPWWGGGDQSSAMIGTFYWHNQYGAFLLAPAIIGLALLIEHRSPWRLVGWIVAPFAVAGIVYSTSRGAMLVGAAAWLLMGVLALRDRRGGRAAFLRWLAATALAVGVTITVAGPPFFSTERAPWSATQARSVEGGSADGNAHYRVYMWREAISVFEHHPIDGVGYGALAPAAAQLTPASWPRSPLAHEDYLQSLADGGLVLGLPFLAACAAIAVWLIAGFRKRLATRTVGIRTGLVVAAGALMAHAAIDFDFSYPALFALAAIVTALATAPAMVRTPSSGTPGAMSNRKRVLRAALVVLLVAATGFGAVAGRHGGVGLAYHPKPAHSAAASQ